jgi:hypothetical protein
MSWQVVSKLDELWDSFCMYVAYMLLPYRVRYWVVIRAGGDASTGIWRDEETPGVTITDALIRMT